MDPSHKSNADPYRRYRFTECYHCGKETEVAAAECIGFINDGRSGFFETATQRWLCPKCAELKGGNPAIGQPKPSAGFLVRAANTSAGGWLILLGLGFFAFIFLVAMPISLIMQVTGGNGASKEIPSWRPARQAVLADEFYRSQFHSEQERIEFEDSLQGQRELMRDAPTDQTSGNDPY